MLEPEQIKSNIPPKWVYVLLSLTIASTLFLGQKVLFEKPAPAITIENNNDMSFINDKLYLFGLRLDSLKNDNKKLHFENDSLKDLFAK